MMRLLTHLGGARATVGAGLLLMVWQPRVGLAALLANASSHVVVQILKRLVARARPCSPDGRPLALVDLPDPFSFPSGHAAAATAVAVTVALAESAVGVPMLPVALAVSVSRVALRVHHVSDVVAGAALGTTGAVWAHRLLL
jgi:undecaprenyl-diphosphatase